MVNENLVTVSNNSNNIDVSITANTNTAEITFDKTMEGALAAHNTASDAHDNKFSDLKNQLAKLTTNITSELDLKLNTSNSYTKTEIDTALSAKLDTSNSTITKQGNTFNGANQLLQLDSSGSIPTALKTDVSGKANTNADNFSTIGKKALTNFAFPSSLNLINMTVPASGTTITAPDDGYITLCSNLNGNICLHNTSTSVNSSGVYFATGYMGSQCHIPVTKGNIIRLFHQGTAGTYLYFIYANGGT